MSECKARQYSDQMMCDYCGLAWDVNDHDPPDCVDRVKLDGNKELQKIKQILKSPN